MQSAYKGSIRRRANEARAGLRIGARTEPCAGASVGFGACNLLQRIFRKLALAALASRKGHVHGPHGG
jgi:hypothetical protein